MVTSMSPTHLELGRLQKVELEIVQLAEAWLQTLGYVHPLDLVGLAGYLLLFVAAVSGNLLHGPLEPVLALLDPIIDPHGFPFPRTGSKATPVTYIGSDSLCDEIIELAQQ